MFMKKYVKKNESDRKRVLKDNVKVDITGNLKIEESENNYNINEDYGLEDKWLGQLINVPSGGLKGLLYYKLITIEKNKLNFCVDISQNAKSKLKKIQKEQLKDIVSKIGSDKE